MLAVSLLLASAFARAVAGDGLTDRIDARFDACRRGDSPGCAIAVIHHGKLAHAQGYGPADSARGIPNPVSS